MQTHHASASIADLPSLRKAVQEWAKGWLLKARRISNPDPRLGEIILSYQGVKKALSGGTSRAKILSVEGRRFRARLVIREALDGKRYYDRDLSEIREELGGTPGDDQRQSVQDQPSFATGGAGPAVKSLAHRRRTA